MHAHQATYRIETSYEDPETLVIQVFGDMNIENAGSILNETGSLLQQSRVSSVKFDISGVRQLDASGAALLISLMKESMQGGYIFMFTGNTEKFDRFLNLLDLDDLVKRSWKPEKNNVPFPVHIGDAVIQFLRDAKETIIFLGGLLYGIGDAIRSPRKIRWSETLYYIEQTGYSAFPIVALISFLIGFIMAFQSASQFQMYGAEIYVADLVGLIITRELGPVMTAIILAGRSGSAFTAEIGTMKISEEIDALSVMGFDTFRFLITPKVIALNLMLPCLTLLSDIIGMAGGLLVGVTTLGLSFIQYINQTYIAVSLTDIFFGLIKSATFGFLIAGIGCYRGMQVTRGADSVGRQTTSSVVTSIFAIILCDAVFSFIDKYTNLF